MAAEGLTAVLRWLTENKLDAIDLLNPLITAGLTSVAKIEAATAADLKTLTPQQRKRVLAAVAKIKGKGGKRKSASGAIVRDQGPAKRGRAEEVMGVDDLAERIQVDEALKAQLDAGTVSADARRILVNRSPVMILWGACVAQILGNDWSSALSLGSAMAGLNARSHGERLGIYQNRPDGGGGSSRSDTHESQEEKQVALLGREFSARVFPAQEAGKPPPLRGLSHDGRIARPRSVLSSLQRSFGRSLELVYEVMMRVARLMDPELLRKNSNRIAYEMYARFRPAVPNGRAGWGAKGPLLLDQVEGIVQDDRFPFKTDAVKIENDSSTGVEDGPKDVPSIVKQEAETSIGAENVSVPAQNQLLCKIANAGAEGIQISALSATEKGLLEGLQLDGLVFLKNGAYVAS
ncbi:Hypothetical Protein FCC1311_082702 [Hondaea fermentalgiana]|uniref:Uncharacterized protein n=1 Tax=Hondaea fermentalgiana TaxID=2315210 RepID=A0A2R5GN53_9STRA|nr:Hypothetical Protein FCC1311_082702 [Hondaea fermentalgiana]|eukprot:GBG32045.1 Hypothetical Protein FCC1311_082702 [Hondaea fermentalgiana]